MNCQQTCIKANKKIVSLKAVMLDISAVGPTTETDTVCKDMRATTISGPAVRAKCVKLNVIFTAV